MTLSTPEESGHDSLLHESIFALIQDIKTRREHYGNQFFGSAKLELQIQNGLCVAAEVSSSLKRTRGKPSGKKTKKVCSSPIDN